jgi:potassium-transporting ATPase KdpC subunit
MLRESIKQIKTALMLVILFTLLTGLIYPLFITGIAQLIFPWRANGSMISQNGQNIGSVFIGQFFDSPKYFWGRPSATTPFAYNALSSTGSNLGPLNPDFLATVKTRAAKLKQSNPTQPVPVDLVTASGSGLDPEISPLAAFYQVPRIAQQRHLTESQVTALIQAHIQKRTWCLLGEPRINVLQLNLALDNLRS